MIQTELTKAIDKSIEVTMKAIDQIIDEYIEPLGKVGNPEVLIKKAYENWTPEDLSMLVQIYGPGEKTPLANLIFRKEYDKVKALEQEELENA